jgi:spore germination cell wall hydrolase CwlJ-like protein
MEISLKPKSSVYINLAAKTLKVAGLSLVLWAVAQVCFQKLEYLKQNRVGLGDNYVTAAEKTKQLECLTRNIYWEAASEPFEGKVGVAQVTMNRVQSGKFASSVCGVVYQKNVVYQKVICQFSWYCENVSKIRPIHKELWNESEEVAKKVLLENFRLPSLKNALYYHADYVNPGWQKPKIEQIGRHIFYGEKNAI